MTNTNDKITEIIAVAIAGMVIVAESDAFSLRHSIIGIILLLLVIRGFRQAKTKFNIILFSSVSSLVLLLTFGKLVDYLYDEFISKGIDRDLTYFSLWLFCTLLVFSIGMIIKTKMSK